MQNISDSESGEENKASIDKNKFRISYIKNDPNQVRLISHRAYNIKLKNVFDNEIEFLLNSIR
jgi:hypothetical protein